MIFDVSVHVQCNTAMIFDVSVRACTRFCFNARLEERLLMHQNLIPVCIGGFPVCVRGGRRKILHMGSPRLHNKIVCILGATYTRTWIL
jgi:hypothetical protein